MKFKKIRLKNFRNYRDLEINFPEGIVIFYGQNGQGKTNLMEAFHFLLRGESFRPSSIETVVFNENHQPAKNLLVNAELEQNGLVHDLKMQFVDGKKALLWNGKRVSSSDLSRTFPLVLFSPESLAAIKEGPDLRRRLLDDLIRTHSTVSIKILKDFRRALKVRNKILKDVKRGIASEHQGKLLLESLDPSYLPLACELTFARLEALKAIHEDLSTAARSVLELKDVDISVEYLISGQNAYFWSRSDILSAMHKRALELRIREFELGASLVGPQKHDVRILFSGKDSRFFCSQGQQRALILSFKMAQILYHHRSYQVYPFLLLDDVLSELDPIRRTNLVKFLRGIPAQIFLTTTDLSFSMDFGDRRPAIFNIENGAVKT